MQEQGRHKSGYRIHKIAHFSVQFLLGKISYFALTAKLFHKLAIEYIHYYQVPPRCLEIT